MHKVQTKRRVQALKGDSVGLCYYETIEKIMNSGNVSSRIRKMANSAPNRRERGSSDFLEGGVTSSTGYGGVRAFKVLAYRLLPGCLLVSTVAP